MVTMQGENGIYEGLSTDTKPAGVPVNTLYHALDTDKWYFWDGENWPESPRGASGFEPTEAQLTAMNSGITATDVEQINTNKTNISLIEQMNGAKNYSRYAGGTTINDNEVLVSDVPLNVAAGDYEVSMDTSNVSGTLSFIFKNSSAETVASVQLSPTFKHSTVAIPATATYFNIFSSKAGTFSNIMIVPKTIWEAGFTDYQPYTMSNAEISAWILAHS